MNAEDLHSYLQRRLPDHLTLLENWVGINSFTRNPSGVAELAQRTAAAFAPLGFSAEAYPSARADIGSHLVLTRRSRTDRTVAFVSHLDTVYTAEEEAANNFFFKRSGDRVYGPGVGDIKGGTLLALMVLDALCHNAPSTFDAVTWHVGLNASEEILEPEFATLFRTRLSRRVLAVLVFEPGAFAAGQWPLVVARKGRAQFRVDVEGCGAHAGIDFWRGRNALIDAARLALRFDDISDRNLERTVNLGRLQGGTVVNRVPHAAIMEGEIRAYSPTALEEGLLRIRRSVDDFVREGGKATLAISEQVPPWPQNDWTKRLLSVWQSAGAALGMSVVSQERGGLSDGNFFWEHYPTLDGLGVTGANFHCSEQAPDGSKEQEFVLQTSFVPKALLNCTALLSLLAADEIAGAEPANPDCAPSPAPPSEPL